MRRKTVGIFSEIVSVISQNDNGFINQMLSGKKSLVNHMCYVPAIDHLLEKCFSSKVISISIITDWGKYAVVFFLIIDFIFCFM